MNPLTNVKNINKLNEIEAELGVSGSKTSWHEQYRDSAYIFIGGMPYDLTEGDVICMFSQYGEIMNINLVRDKKTGKSKGYCFLAYEDQRSTILAVDNFNGIKLLGRVLRVDHVSNYRKPKEDENDDEITQQLRQEGCAPRTPPSEDDEEREYLVPKKKNKKEHKTKPKLQDKKKKKKKKHKKDEKYSSKSRTDSSDSESSYSEKDNSPRRVVRVKEEVDRGYPHSSELKIITEQGWNDGHKRHQQEVSHWQKEKGCSRGEGRKWQREERVANRDEDYYRHGERYRLDTSRHESNSEERRDGKDKWHDRGSHNREDRHPDKWSDREDAKSKERDKTQERRREKGNSHQRNKKYEREDERLDTARSESNYERRKRDQSNEKDARRGRGSYYERDRHYESD
ncbi:RNA-binding motif protein, X-linked 2-like isoform X3 [Acanthaster planci]|uniref:RNA-binding motif protein, X-linked 2-like isoform X2 n=1 Tax=Acanthaster planci TaxID=133434 RepID=A0A8B7YRV3_ACAPL|nr:RNA-binding motif protein, X-linked 2-like isoform X2 [Acanthaster planci]XP_022095196.1 RNA-binding motif protein, X-linked 2-like isoform X3 [Acanthaster planci]